MPRDVKEYFAAYIYIPRNCSGEKVIKDIQSHGADYIFLSFEDHFQTDSVAKNVYDNLVFITEIDKDPF